jgi:hypothetical protein
MICTIYRNIYSKDPHYISVKDALKRIEQGRSKEQVEQIRATIDKEKAGKLKANLPSVCFSGKFGNDRKDDQLIEHSGFVVLDFDNVNDLRNRQSEIISNEFVHACWISPSGNGLKALIRIADGKKHREHFQALQEVFPDIDKSGINPSRVCYESFDQDVYLNEKAAVFASLKVVERVKEVEVNSDDSKIFNNLVTWLSNKKEAFVTGERNNFIFKLASACCRYGIDEDSAIRYVGNRFLVGSDFSTTEAGRTIRSAYRVNKSKFGDCCFEQERLVEKVTRRELKVEQPQFDDSEKAKDVIYGIDVKEEALRIYDHGFEKVKGIGVEELDHHFKFRRGEITLLSGYGNHGKSTFKKWYKVMRMLLYGEKFATFSPEENPASNYYEEMTEILLGCDCTPNNPHRPSREIYEKAYDFITDHVFFIYPKDLAPTPEYIKERFLELIVKEKIDGIDIDPFNQMAHSYTNTRTDQYLEAFLGDYSRFAQINNLYALIVAHPNGGKKDASGNYPCPDVFDLAGGAMWNNKMDNILIYHRPFFQTDPANPTSEFHSKKIRRQKIVGKRGFFLFEMIFRNRRFYFNGSDPMQKVINEKGFDFKPKQTELEFGNNVWTPFTDQPF